MTTSVQKSLAVLCLISLGIGCGDEPQKKSVNNVNNANNVNNVNNANNVNNIGQQVDFSGTYLLGIGTAVSATPLLLEADVSVSGDFSIDFVFQPIKTDFDPATGDPRADSRTPVGDPITVTGVPLNQDGTFRVDLGEAPVDGDANPISGSDLVANIVLDGVVQSATFFCGDVSGQISEPIALPLDGSTFGAVELGGQDITTVAPVSSCTTPPNNANNTNNGGSYTIFMVQDATSGLESCDVGDPGSDIIQIALQDTDGDIRAWGNLVGDGILSEGNDFDRGDNIDGTPPSQLTACPEFRDDTVTSLGCGGYVLVEFIGLDGFPTEAVEGEEILVYEFGAPFCPLGSMEDLYDVYACTQPSAVPESCNVEVIQDGTGLSSGMIPIF